MIKNAAEETRGVARERCRLYYCPGSDDFECVRSDHGPLEPCCDQPELHRTVPLSHCRHSPPKVRLDPPPAPGPDPYPNQVRIEFELPGRDMYYAAKDVLGALEAGWSPAECWLLSGETIPKTWDSMCHDWGYENLIAGLVLVPRRDVDALVDQAVAERIQAAIHKASDAKLLADPDLRESLEQMRRGQGITRIAKPTTTEEDPMPG